MYKQLIISKVSNRNLHGSFVKIPLYVSDPDMYQICIREHLGFGSAISER